MNKEKEYNVGDLLIKSNKKNKKQIIGLIIAKDIKQIDRYDKEDNCEMYTVQWYMNNKSGNTQDITYYVETELDFYIHRNKEWKHIPQ